MARFVQMTTYVRHFEEQYNELENPVSDLKEFAAFAAL